MLTRNRRPRFCLFIRFCKNTAGPTYTDKVTVVAVTPIPSPSPSPREGGGRGDRGPQTGPVRKASPLGGAAAPLRLWGITAGQAGPPPARSPPGGSWGQALCKTSRSTAVCTLRAPCWGKGLRAARSPQTRWARFPGSARAAAPGACSGDSRPRRPSPALGAAAGGRCAGAQVSRMPRCAGAQVRRGPGARGPRCAGGSAASRAPRAPGAGPGGGASRLCVLASSRTLAGPRAGGTFPARKGAGGGPRGRGRSRARLLKPQRPGGVPQLRAPAAAPLSVAVTRV